MTKKVRAAHSHKKDTMLNRMQELIDIEHMFQSLFEHNPAPVWLKWVRHDHLLMGFVNAAYTKATGISLEAYKGERDKVLWGDTAGEGFNEADLAVIRKRTPVRIAELAENPLSGEMEYWVGWKWPYIVRGKVVGVWGRALPIRQEVYEEHEELIQKLLRG